MLEEHGGKEEELDHLLTFHALGGIDVLQFRTSSSSGVLCMRNNSPYRHAPNLGSPRLRSPLNESAMAVQEATVFASAKHSGGSIASGGLGCEQPLPAGETRAGTPLLYLVTPPGERERTEKTRSCRERRKKMEKSCWETTR